MDNCVVTGTLTMKNKEISADYHKGWVSGFDARSIDIDLAIREIKLKIGTPELPVKELDVELVLNAFIKEVSTGVEN